MSFQTCQYSSLLLQMANVWQPMYSLFNKNFPDGTNNFLHGCRLKLTLSIGMSSSVSNEICRKRVISNVIQCPNALLSRRKCMFLLPIHSPCRKYNYIPHRGQPNLQPLHAVEAIMYPCSFKTFYLFFFGTNKKLR